jgi:hypothetical protein
LSGLIFASGKIKVLHPRYREMRVLVVSLALMAVLPRLNAALGESTAQSISRYGNPERNALKQSGLLCFRKRDLCAIAHFQDGKCDVLSLFSTEDDMGLPKDLGSERIKSLLKSEGGNSGWTPLPGFTINGVWDSADGKCFAIYDTMRHKLVIMTREAYHREKEAKKEASSAR